MAEGALAVLAPQGLAAVAEACTQAESGYRQVARGCAGPVYSLARSRTGFLEALHARHNELHHTWRVEPVGSRAVTVGLACRAGQHTGSCLTAATSQQAWQKTSTAMDQADSAASRPGMQSCKWEVASLMLGRPGAGGRPAEPRPLARHGAHLEGQDLHRHHITLARAAGRCQSVRAWRASSSCSLPGCSLHAPRSQRPETALHTDSKGQTGLSLQLKGSLTLRVGLPAGSMKDTRVLVVTLGQAEASCAR